MVSLSLESIARSEEDQSKGLVNLEVAWCIEDACDYPPNATENLAENFINTVSTEESWEGCVKAEVLIAQQSFQASLWDRRVKAWATQGWSWPSTLLKIVSDAEDALAGAAAPASLCQKSLNDTEGSPRLGASWAVVQSPLPQPLREEGIWSRL